jgi:uncharacterized protein YjbI with pentapeptide repeats
MAPSEPPAEQRVKTVTQAASPNAAPSEARPTADEQPSRDPDAAARRKPEVRMEAPSWLVASVSETSKNASQVYVLYMSFLAYCVLTIFTTSDEQIILNQSTLLPLVNLTVPSNIFFVFAPLIAIGLFIHLQFYQCRMGTILDVVNADYTPIERERLYPWLLNFAANPDHGFVGTLQRRVVEVSLWWLLPVVLAIFAFWNFRRHIISLSVEVAGLHIAGTILVIYFWHRANPRNRIGACLLMLTVVAFEAVLLGLLIFFVEPGYPGARYNDPRQTWTAVIKRFTTIDLSYQDFTSAALKTFLLRDLQKVHLEGAALDQSIFNNAHLYGAYLQAASLNLAKLQNADLTEANLEGANLSAADFTRASLIGADLAQAFLAQTNLTKARLVTADLRNAVLAGANLQGAFLSTAKLSGATLNSANLEGTNLEFADLEGADLRDASGLTAEQVSSACTLYRARLDEPLMKAMKLKYSRLLEKPKRDKEGNCCRGAC